MGIFKGKLDIQKTANSIFSGVDKSIFTKEEISDVGIEQVKANLEFVKTTQAESTPRSKTRRIIAIMILGQYFLSFNIGLVGMATGLYKGKEIIELSTAAFATLAISVVIFYFGRHMLTALVPTFGKRKDK